MRKAAPRTARSPSSRCIELHFPPPAKRWGREKGSLNEIPLLRRSLRLLDALAVVAAAALQPFQAAIGIGRFVGLVLIEAGFAPDAAGFLVRIFGIEDRRENHIRGDAHGAGRSG